MCTDANLTTNEHCLKKLGLKNDICQPVHCTFSPCNKLFQVTDHQAWGPLSTIKSLSLTMLCVLKQANLKKLFSKKKNLLRSTLEFPFAPDLVHRWTFQSMAMSIFSHESKSFPFLFILVQSWYNLFWLTLFFSTNNCNLHYLAKL